MTPILKEIDRIYEKGGISHYLDQKLKSRNDAKYGSNYYGIYTNENCRFLLVLDHFDKKWLLVTTPNQLSPDLIKTRYGLEGEGDPNTGLVRHYYLWISYDNELLNNRFSIKDKRNFFSEMARMR